MLAAFQINANGGDYALAREEFAIDHQHEQLFGNWPLQQLLELLGGGSLPMPAHTRTLDPVTFKTTLDGSFVVSGRALPYQLPLHRLLHLPVLLKGRIGVQSDFFILATAQARPLQLDLAPPKDHVSGLLPMSADPLPTPHLSLDLDLPHLAD